MTQLLLNCYTSEMKYYLENNISFKVLHIVYRVPTHPPFIGDLHPNTKVVSLPPNITSLIEPMNQSVISAFKDCYLRKPLSRLLLHLRERLRWQWCKTGRITTGMIASRTLVGLGVMSKKYVNGIRKKTLSVPPWLQRICQRWGGCKNQQVCGWDGKQL